MRFGPTALGEAEGGILAHTLLLPDGSRIRKGQVLGAEEVERLRRNGLSLVTVALLDPSDVPEDQAALEVARALAGEGTEIGRPGTEAGLTDVVVHALDEDRDVLTAVLDAERHGSGA